MELSQCHQHTTLEVTIEILDVGVEVLEPTPDPEDPEDPDASGAGAVSGALDGAKGTT